MRHRSYQFLNPTNVLSENFNGNAQFCGSFDEFSVAPTAVDYDPRGRAHSRDCNSECGYQIGIL